MHENHTRAITHSPEAARHERPPGILSDASDARRYAASALLLDFRKGGFVVKVRDRSKTAGPPPASSHLGDDAHFSEMAAVVGDISHDIKNMITPSLGGIFTLQALLEDMFSALEDVRASCGTDALWARFEEAVDEVRKWSPEFCDMVCTSVEAVQERAHQIVVAMTGSLSAPDLRPTHAAEIVTRVMRHLHLTAEHARVRLVLDAPDDLPAADLDGWHLYNAVYNLLNNAIAETPPGGGVTVRLSCETGAPGKGDTLLLAVSDTGRGMQEEVVQRLFAEERASTKKGGSGLGLRIVKKVVDLHGGTLAVESVPGRGTTFTLRLPLRRDPAAQPFPPDSAEA